MNLSFEQDFVSKFSLDLLIHKAFYTNTVRFYNYFLNVGLNK